MEVLGIIAEYNPYHKGHAFHFEKSKQIANADTTVCVMSGNFVQRGEPALCDKWSRAHMAVQNGIDLVLELPFVFACNNSELFAKGSVSILDKIGVVDAISFGSESGELDILRKVALTVAEESYEFSHLLKTIIKTGVSFPVARAKALEKILGKDYAQTLKSPNNILAIEYLKQLKLLNSDIKPITIKRYGASLDEINADDEIAGATAIRNIIKEESLDAASMYLTKATNSYLLQENPEITDIENFRDIIFYSVLSSDRNELSNVYAATEGLENKMIKEIESSQSIKQFIANIKSKRYTETRVKRLLIHTLMNLTKAKMKKILDEDQIYTRVLAFNKKGASLLKKIKNEDCSSIPILTNISKQSEEVQKMTDIFEYDIRSSQIYNLMSNGDLYANSEYRKIPVNIDFD